MITDADADEVGLNVVGGEGEGGKQVFVEIVAGGYFLVKQQPIGRRVEGNVVANAQIEHETYAVEQHFVCEQEAGFQVDVPIRLGDFVGVVVNQFHTDSHSFALRDLEHEVGGQIVDEIVLVCTILLA